MEIPVRDQLIQACVGLLAGGTAGLFWDVLRFFRRRLPRPLGIAAGAAGLLITAVFVFLSGQGCGSGMRLFYLSACALGWAIYLWGLGDAVGELFDRLSRLGPKHTKKQKKIQ